MKNSYVLAIDMDVKQNSELITEHMEEVLPNFNTEKAKTYFCMMLNRSVSKERAEICPICGKRVVF